MTDHEIGVSVWVWDKQGKPVSTGFNNIKNKPTEEETIELAKHIANNEWLEWDGKIFDIHIEIVQGKRSLKKVLFETKNYKTEDKIKAVTSKIKPYKRRR